MPSPAEFHRSKSRSFYGFLFFETAVIIRALIKITLHTIYQLGSKNPLDFTSAKCTGNPGTLFPVVRVSRADSKFFFFSSTGCPAAFFKLPTIHRYLFMFF